MAKQIEAYRLRTQIEVDAKKGRTELKAVEKDVDKVGTRFTKLGKEISTSMKGAEVGKKFGSDFGASATSAITGSIKSLGQTLGGLIGTVIAPGIGTAIGGTIGSAVDAALDKVSGPMLASIQKGIELNKLLEQTRIEFTTFTGSEKEAVEYLERLKKLSADTGKPLAFLVDASESLYDFTQDLKLSSTILQASIDKAADIGGGPEKIRQIGDALGLIAEKGDLSAQSLKQLYKLKINAPELLAQATGLSTKRIKQLMAEGRIDGVAAARMIAEGLQRETAGFAQKLAMTTAQGREERFGAIADMRAQEGTVNITRRQGELYGYGANILAGGGAKKAVAYIDQFAGTIFDNVEKAVSAGVSLGGGLVEGISSGAPKVFDAVADIGTGAIGTLKTLWGIESPSKVFAGLGFMAVEGLEDGLVDRTAKGFDKWGEALEKAGGDAFVKGIAGIARRIGVDPAWLLNVIAFESEFNPKAANPRSSGRGLIQIMGSTARGMGLRSSNQVTKLSAMDQLPLIEQYYKPFAGKMKNQGDTYSVVAAGRVAGASGVLFKKGSKEYAANQIWDANRDGIITSTEIGKLASQKGGFSSRGGYQADAVAATIEAAQQANRMAITANGKPITNTDPMPVVVIATAMAANAQAKVQGVATVAGAATKWVDALTDKDRVKSVVAASQAANDIASVVPPVDRAMGAAGIGLGAFATALPPLTDGLVDFGKTARAEFALTNEVMRRNQEELIRSIDLRDQLSGMISQAAGFLPQQEVGKKRGFFSKLLGFAAPFLSFIPGVGPILSQVAGIASNAAAGNWAGVATGIAGGFASGGAFRRSSSPGSSTGGPSVEDARGRAMGGPVRRGRPYIVGEHRPELFVPDSNGYVHPGVGSGAGMADLLERLTRSIENLNSMPADHVVMKGARGMLRAYDNDAGLIRLTGQKFRMA